MQWLGLAILLGILITLFLAARYFGDTQKTHNERPKSAGLVQVPTSTPLIQSVISEGQLR